MAEGKSATQRWRSIIPILAIYYRILRVSTNTLFRPCVYCHSWGSVSASDKPHHIDILIFSWKSLQIVINEKHTTTIVVVGRVHSLIFEAKRDNLAIRSADKKQPTRARSIVQIIQPWQQQHRKVHNNSHNRQLF